MSEPRQPDHIDVTAGIILKRLRNYREITQEQLAEAIGVTFQQIQKYEKGKNRISVSKLFAICKKLDYLPDSFLADVRDEIGKDD